MPAPSTDILTRLRAANPAPVSPERAHEPIAQATLDRILTDPGREADSRPPRRNDRPASRARRSVPGLAIVLALMVACAGGALAATDPFGWFSTNPDQARYGSNPAVHVATPTAPQIRCHTGTGGRFTCLPERTVCSGLSTNHASCRISGTGQAYDKIDAIHQPLGASFSRASFLAGIKRGLANHTITASLAAKIRADLARVPDSFFTELRLASRYGTYGTGYTSQGRESVPPPGVPDTLVCQNAPHGLLSCRDLNGDLNAPVGAGVFGAIPEKGWRTVSAPKSFGGGLPPGIHFSKAERQILIDLVLTATTHSSSGGTTKAIRLAPSSSKTGQP